MDALSAGNNLGLNMHSAEDITHDMQKKIHLNVSGRHYDISCKVMESVNGSKLQTIAKNVRKSTDSNSDFFFERPVAQFEAILAFHQTGKFHIPKDVCPGSLKDELEFWGIDPNHMEKCCYQRYVSFVHEQDILEGFLWRSKEDKKNGEAISEKHPPLVSRLRNRAWLILDNREESFVSKVYFTVATAFILVVVFATAFSTLPSIRNMSINNGEMEAEPSAGPFTTTGRDLSKFCSGPCPDNFRKLSTTSQASLSNYTTETLDQSSARTIENNTEDNLNTSIAPVTQRNSNDRTLGSSVLPFRLDSNDVQVNDHNNATLNTDEVNATYKRNPNITATFKSALDGFVKNVVGSVLSSDPKEKILTVQTAMSNHQIAFIYLEYVTNVFFTTELILRIICCPVQRRYIFSFQNSIDMLALGGVYLRGLLYELLTSDYHCIIDALLYLQMLRVFRLLRLLDQVTAFHVLCYSVKKGKKDLLVMLLYIVMGVLFFSNFIYFVEESVDFPSIPDAWWWSMVTMTTVGYGDSVPKTAAGKVIGSLCAFSGVIMFSLVIPIFVNNFITLYQYAEINKRSLEKSSLRDIKENFRYGVQPKFSK